MPILESNTSTLLHPSVAEAYQVLEGKPVSRELALALSRLSGADVLDLVSLARKVANRFAPQPQVCTILNAKSGACAEDCKFCAQSGHHATDIETYPLLDEAAILKAADQAYASGVRFFGLVTSGTGYDKINPEFKAIVSAIQTLHQRYPDMQVCASLGMLSPETAAALGQVKISHYNINLQVNPARYAELVSSTHAIEERMQTIRLLQTHGIKTCVGGILGLGETMADRVELAFSLQALQVDVIPLNVLLPIPGTALASQAPIPAVEIVKTFALFRLILPSRTIKFAAGRETKMKDFQALLLLAGANGFLTGGYLTTRGRDTAEDLLLLQELDGFR